MPQEGSDPQVQSHASYEESALPPSHHGTIYDIIEIKGFNANVWNHFFRKERVLEFDVVVK